MISHEFQTIFIHIPRTAGTSVEIALAGNNWWKIDPASKHIDWRHAKDLYSDCWQEYMKFSIVRSPWDWLASLYFSHRRGGDKSWEEFVQDPNFYPHEQALASQSEIIGMEMDLVLRFETLQEDFTMLCQKLGISRQLPHVQIGDGSFLHYSEVYTPELADSVAQRYAADIDRFGYQFIPLDTAKAQNLKSTVSTLKARIASLEAELRATKSG